MAYALRERKLHFYSPAAGPSQDPPQKDFETIRPIFQFLKHGGCGGGGLTTPAHAQGTGCDIDKI